jgi:hypothetical protein
MLSYSLAAQSPKSPSATLARDTAIYAAFAEAAKITIADAVLNAWIRDDSIGPGPT